MKVGEKCNWQMLYSLGTWPQHLQSRSSQILHARLPGWLNFVRWHVIFLGPLYGGCFMSPFWCPKFWGCVCIFGRSVHPCYEVFYFHSSIGFIQVRIQTQPGFVSTLRAAAPLIYKDEGMNGFYKGLVPLWMRQIPYTMMKFACFEKTIELLYRYVNYIYTSLIYLFWI